MSSAAHPRLSRVIVFHQVLLCAGAYFLYFGVRNLTEGSFDRALANAQALIRFERALGIYWEPGLQRAIIEWDLAVTLANWVYMWAHWPLIISAAVWLLLRHPKTFFLVRNAMFISGAIGMVIFATLPMAPPRLVESEVVDTITLHSNSYRVLQPPGFTNQYAAMPSLHFGWNLLIGIAIVREGARRAVRLVGWLSPPAMAVATVLTANHYLLDVVAGGALALLGLLLAIWLRDHRRPAARSSRPLRHVTGVP